MRIVHNVRVIASVSFAFIFLAPFFVQKASALDLFSDDEIFARLKRNQLLSDKDITEIKGSYPKLSLEGNLQLQYVNGQNGTTPDRVSDLYMKRLNLRITANLSDLTSIVFEPEYGRGEPSIKDAYLSYKPAWFEVFAGNHRVPFSADTMKNDINLQFAERNLASQLSPDYLPGVSVVKPMLGSLLLVQAGVWNGNINSSAESGLINNSLAQNRIFSSNTGNSGSNILIEALRIAYSSKERDNFYQGRHSFENDENFNGELSYGMGLSFYNSASIQDKPPANGLTGINGASGYETDFQLKIWRLAMELEYSRRNLDWWQYNFALTSNELVASAQTAIATQASILVTENLSLGLRYESFKYDSKKGVLKGAFGQDQDKWLTAGVNYYFKDQHTKIQANFVKKSSDMPGGDSSRAIDTTYIQATMYF